MAASMLHSVCLFKTNKQTKPKKKKKIKSNIKTNQNNTAQKQWQTVLE